MGEVWNQRVVRHSGRLYHLPNAMFWILMLDLVWEVTRQNMSPEARLEWPWRFTLLDVSTSGTAVGVLGGFLLARTQFIRASRPALGWTGYSRPQSDNMTLASKWIVHVHNGGPGVCTALKVEYRIAVNSERSREPGPWSTIGAVVSELAKIGLELGKHYSVNEQTPGAVFVVMTDQNSQMELAAFGERALSVLQAFDVRLVVEDVVGEVHERVIRCLYSAHRVGVGSGGTLPE